MSDFPAGDEFWEDALFFLEATLPKNVTVSAQKEFEGRLPEGVDRIPLGSVLGDIVVLHKGELDWLEDYYRVAQKLQFLTPIFANEVFVILTSLRDITELEDRTHLKSLQDQLNDLSIGPLSFGTRSMLESAARKRRHAVGIGEGKVLCKVLGRYSMIADMEALQIAPHLVQDGFWESWVTVAISKYLSHGGYYVDVGANIGYYSVLFAQAAGQEGRVLAVEPRESFCRVLRQNFVMNGCYERWEVLQAAAGDDSRTKEITLWEPPGYASSAYVGVAPDRPNHLDCGKVPIVSLDRHLREWPRVDIVKIDAEGGTSGIWKGLVETRQRSGTVFFVEYFHDKAEDRDWLEGVREEGFHVCHVGLRGSILPGLPDDTDDWTMLCLSKPKV